MTQTTATRNCGCPEQTALTARTGFTRRQLFARAGLLGVAAASAPLLQTHYAYAADPNYTGDTLVVLSFRGGMDGLSVVVPYGDPDYANLRPTIGLNSGQVLAGDGYFGLHPALAPLVPFWTAGTFGAVQACGLPAPDRSHFQATEEMEKAAFNSSLRTGWLDRMLGVRGVSNSSFQAMEVGNSLPPDSLLGPNPSLALYSLDSFNLDGSSNSDRTTWSTALKALHSGAATSLQQPANTTLAAIATVAGMGSADDYVPANGATYDSNSSLSSAMRDVARLIKAKVGLQIACIDYGDWDMHVGLGPANTSGNIGGSDDNWMRDHLDELAKALAAFATDLGTAGMQDVTLVTLTEFGRRVEENGDHGVDHGYGTSVLLMGGGVAGGQVHLNGPWPTLADNKLIDGDLNATTDYRSVLSEVLSKRCRVTAGGLSSIFPGAPSASHWVGAVSTKV
jgi:uncharacterized protein (DUF1501 family)